MQEIFHLAKSSKRINFIHLTSSRGASSSESSFDIASRYLPVAESKYVARNKSVNSRGDPLATWGLDLIHPCRGAAATADIGAGR